MDSFASLKIITDNPLLTRRLTPTDTITNQLNVSDATVGPVDSPTVYSPASIAGDIDLILESDTPASVHWKDSKITILTSYLNTY